jgi:ribosomal protein S18 acetylase RimI-like enzyme
MINNIVEVVNEFDLKQVVEISKLNLLDFSQISEVNYVENIEKTGFFIAPYNLDDLRNDRNKILLGVKEDNKIVAFIWISVDTDNHKYNWCDKKFEKEISGQKIYNLKRIGVTKEKNGQGLASELLKSVNEYFFDKSIKYLLASVAYSPIKNLASIGFLEKNGFEKVAISPEVPHYKFDNYQCLLLAKRID